MPKYSFFVLIFALGSSLWANGYPRGIPTAFLGIERGREINFASRLEDQVLQKIRFLPGAELVGQDSIARIKTRGGLRSPVLSEAEAQDMAAFLGSRLISFGRIEQWKITKHRLWYFPVFGYFRARLELAFIVYDAEAKSYRFRDHLVYTAKSASRYAGIGRFDLLMMLSAEDRLTLENKTVEAAGADIEYRMRLSLLGLLPESNVIVSEPKPVIGHGTEAGADSATGAVKADSSKQNPKPDTGKSEPEKPVQTPADSLKAPAPGQGAAPVDTAEEKPAGSPAAAPPEKSGDPAKPDSGTGK